MCVCFGNEKSKRLCRLARTRMTEYCLRLILVPVLQHRTYPTSLIEFDFLSICGRCGDCGDVIYVWISIDNLDVCRQDSHDSKKKKLKIK